MSEPMSQNNQIPSNWWGYDMPPELFTISSGLPQVFDAAGKAPISTAAPVLPMTQETSICYIDYCVTVDGP